MRSVLALFVVLALAVSAQAQYVTAPAQGSCANGKCYTPPAYSLSQAQRQQYAYPPSYYQPYYVVPKQQVASLTFEVYKIGDGQWGWELKVEAKVLSRSVEVYKTKQDAAQVAQELFGAARTVVVKERAAKAAETAGKAASQAVIENLQK